MFKPPVMFGYPDRTSLAEPTCAAVGEVLKTQEFSKRPEGRNRQAECTTMA